jgi:hypothetical protein
MVKIKLDTPKYRITETFIGMGIRTQCYLEEKIDKNHFNDICNGSYDYCLSKLSEHRGDFIPLKG